MRKAAILLGLAGLFGTALFLMTGCEAVVQPDDTKTDYADNSRFFGSYTGLVQSGDTLANEGDSSASAVETTMVIGSDVSRRDEGWVGWYLYIPQSGNGETFTSTNAAGEAYTETIQINGSTLSFHVVSSSTTADMVLDFTGDYNSITAHNNGTDTGVPYSWTATFIRVGTDTSTMTIHAAAPSASKMLGRMRAAVP
jgi:hypothetical protein